MPITSATAVTVPITVVSTRPRRGPLGDTALILLAPATDITGRRWWPGTTVQPIAHGADSVRGVAYREVTIGRERVRFATAPLRKVRAQKVREAA